MRQISIWTLSWGLRQVRKKLSLHLIFTEIRYWNFEHFHILESRLNKLRAFDLITQIGWLETERTRYNAITCLYFKEITNTKIRSCQFRCFTNNTVNVRRFTFLLKDISDNNLGSSKLSETKAIRGAPWDGSTSRRSHQNSNYSVSFWFQLEIFITCPKWIRSINASNFEPSQSFWA